MVYFTVPLAQIEQLDEQLLTESNGWRSEMHACVVHLR